MFFSNLTIFIEFWYCFQKVITTTITTKLANIRFVGLARILLNNELLIKSEIKLNYDLISISLKSNYDVIICTFVSYFLLSLIGRSKTGSTNENLVPLGGAKCN
jgi:hypothetical protein